MPATKRRLSYSDYEGLRSLIGLGQQDAASADRTSILDQDGNRNGDSYHGANDDRADRIKRPRLTYQAKDNSPPLQDHISRLSDELLVRIFSYMDEKSLIDIATVSKRFASLSSDSHLWRILYYHRFILPRAHRIPGFKAGKASNSTLSYSSHGSVMADGSPGHRVPSNPVDPTDKSANYINQVDWKKQYKLRHNWAKGSCQVDEIEVSRPERNDHEQRRRDEEDDRRQQPEASTASHHHSHHPTAATGTEYGFHHYQPVYQQPSQHDIYYGSAYPDQYQPQNPPPPPPPVANTLVKVTDGLAVTVDVSSGLRAWDLRTRKPIARIDIRTDQGVCLRPTTMSLDTQCLSSDVLEIAVGFEDGTFGIWRLHIIARLLTILFRQDKSFSGTMISIAYSYPYVFTAAQFGFISLYTFDPPAPEIELQESIEHDIFINTPLVKQEVEAPVTRSKAQKYEFRMCHGDEEYHGDNDNTDDDDDDDDEYDDIEHEMDDFENEDLDPFLEEPYLLTFLKSHYSGSPLALSIRKLAVGVIASIAYTFETVGGWSIGIQDFDIVPSTIPTEPDTITSRVAYAMPTETRHPISSASSSSASYSYRNSYMRGPVKLSYSHPYLLATLPDNTLVLHLCTSHPSSLSISKGLRLWGHTSAISDADITPRGKAVSVSARGDEIRVWDLEGRVAGRSVAVRPRPSTHTNGLSQNDLFTELLNPGSSTQREPKSYTPESDVSQNWVGFDDEMIVVLKEANDGRESLALYDFS